MPTIEGPLLLYDGECALCSRAVRLVLARDTKGTVRFAPLRGSTAAALLADRPHIAGIDSMVWIGADGKPLTRSAAAMAIGRHLGGAWSRVAASATILPEGIRDGIYDWIARVRHRAFGRDSCPAFAPEHVSRFLP